MKRILLLFAIMMSSLFIAARSNNTIKPESVALKPVPGKAGNAGIKNAGKGGYHGHQLAKRFVAPKNGYLTNLTVSAGTLSPKFDPEIQRYIVMVDASVTTISIGVEFSDIATEAVINKSDLPDTPIELAMGENVMPVYVYGTGGSVTKYTLYITRGNPVSPNNFKALKPSRGKLVPAFEPEVLNYTLKVGVYANNIYFTAEAQDDVYPVMINDSTHLGHPLSVAMGENVYSIVKPNTDGSTTTYTVTVTRSDAGESSVNTLATAAVSIGVLDKPFNPDSLDYVLRNVPNGTTQTRLTFAVTDPKSTLAFGVGDGFNPPIDSPADIGFGLSETYQSKVYVYVTAEDGSVRTYSFTCNPIPPVPPGAKLSRLYVRNPYGYYSLDPYFSPNVYSYTSSVDTELDSVFVDLSTADPEAVAYVTVGNEVPTVSGSRRVAIPQGNSTIKISVLPADGSGIKVYEIHESRFMSLKALNLSTGTIIGGFNGGFTNFRVKVPPGTTSLTVAPQAYAGYSSFTTNGAPYSEDTPPVVTLDGDGKASINFQLIAADGVTINNYTINIETGVVSTVKTLASATVDIGSFKTPFDPAVNNHEISVPAGTTEVRLTFSLADSLSRANGSEMGSPFTWNIGLWNNEPQTTSITVTAEDNSENTYNFRIVPTGSDSNLSGLVTSVGTYSPVFDPATTEYYMELGSDVDSLTVTPITNDPLATAFVNGSGEEDTLSGAKTIPLTDGLSYASIYVRPSNGSYGRYYGLTIKRPLRITSLTADVGRFSPAFDPNVTEYSLKVPAGTTLVSFIPATDESQGRVTFNGNFTCCGNVQYVSLDENGEATVTATVATWGGENPKTYTIHVSRGSNVSTLNDIALSEGALSPSFDAATTDYTALAASANITVNPKPTVPDAATTLILNGSTVPKSGGLFNVPLVVGNNTLVLTTTSEEGTSSTSYNLTITRTYIPPALSGITASTGTLSPAFSDKVTDYLITVPAGTADINFTAMLGDTTSVLSINGTEIATGTASANITLNNGFNSIPVIVNKADGTTVTYTLHINKLVPVPTGGGQHTYVLAENKPATGLNSTISGVGTAGYAPIATVAAHVNKATAVVVNKQGEVFTTSNGTPGAIIKTSADGSHADTVITGLVSPLGLAIDANDNVYATSVADRAVKKIAAGTGAITELYNDTYGQTGIAIDTAGTIYTSEVINGTIGAMRPGGNYFPVATGFDQPIALAVKPNGDILVADQLNGELSTVLTGQSTKTSFLTGLQGPSGVQIDALGNIYVSMATSGVVTKYDKTGANPVNVYSGLSSPLGVALAGNGKVYIAENTTGMVKKVTPSGGYYLNELLPDGLVFDAATGAISGTPTVLLKPKKYIITGYNTAGSVADTLTLSVVSDNANLSSVYVTYNPVLTPSFSPSVTSYSLSTNETSVSIYPYLSDHTARVRVNGSSTTHGQAVSTGTLAVGLNVIPVEVEAAYGNTKTYTFNITRTLSPVTGLSALSASTGTLSPATFDTNVLNYSMSVPYAVSDISLTPKAVEFHSTITVNGVPTDNTTASAPVALAMGANAIPVVVTSQDGNNVKTYTVTVNRAVVSTSTYLPSIKMAGGITVTKTSNSPKLYNAAVAGGVSSVQVIATASQATTTIRIEGQLVASGVASQPIPVNTGTNTIHIVATAEDGTTTENYTITVTRALSASTYLPSIKVSPSSILVTKISNSPKLYTASAPNETTSIRVWPTASDTTAVIRVEGEVVASGTLSSPINLNVGANTIKVVVTAQDGVTTELYTLTITRAPSSSTYLPSIKLKPGVLVTKTSNSPKMYTASVAYEYATVQVVPTANDTTATIRVAGQVVASGTPSQAIPVNVGANTITVMVTAQDGVTTEPYTITVTRAPSNSTYLPSIKLKPGVLVTKTSNSPKTYTATVAYEYATVQVVPTANDPNATIRIAGQVVASGAPSQAIPVNVGANTITVVVTAQDGTTTETYTITVTRVASNITYLTSLKVTPSVSDSKTSNKPKLYVAKVAAATASVQVVAVASDENSTIRVEGQVVASGALSQAIPLSVGDYVIHVVVTAQDGTTTENYTMTVTRPLLSSSTYLPSIKISPSSFAVTKTSNSPKTYTATVNAATASIKVLPTANDPTTSIKVAGQPVANGTLSQAITLNNGDNVIEIWATAQDGTTELYKLTVTRPIPPVIASVNKNNTTINVVQKPEPIADALPEELIVKQALSPNGDGINDKFTIAGINAFPDNTVRIMNRNGDVIYEAKGYDNESKAFDGHNSRGTLQQPGTYFYSVEYKKGTETKRKTGYIVLKY